MQEPLPPFHADPVPPAAYISPETSTLPTLPTPRGGPVPSGRGGRAIARRRLLSLTGGMAAALSLIFVGSSIGPPTPGVSYQGLGPGQVIERVRQEMIPQDDSSTPYGVSFSAAGYQTLLSWHSQMRVTRGKAGSFEALDVTLPCCGFGQPSADESTNCGCGHHQALYGLAKRLLGLGYSEQQAQDEIDRWAAYFFPRETMEAALAERAASDPAYEEALDEFRQKGGC